MKLWITVATFNRKNVTEIAIRQLVAFRQDSFVHVTDDYSTEFDLEWLQALGVNEVARPPHKMGIDAVRVWELRKFLTTDCELCYLTDNDAFHDPAFVDVLKQGYRAHHKPVSLYNSSFHWDGQQRLDGAFIIRPTIPGISQLYDRKTAETILAAIDAHHPGGVEAWDYTFVRLAQTDAATSNISYVQHYGAYGIHNSSGDHDRCVASNPSQHLVDTRADILNRLRSK